RMRVNIAHCALLLLCTLAAAGVESCDRSLINGPEEMIEFDSASKKLSCHSEKNTLRAIVL
ncbi:hypothetical protein PMAYCL1PPCAC_04410, partial [Pristionchus mayeri]